MGTNNDLNTESFVFFDSSGFKTTEWCKARITALTLLDRTSNALSCISSLVNATSRYLNFSNCFNDTRPTSREHWTGYLESCSTSVLEMLVFIPAMSYAAAKSFNAFKRQDSNKASKTISVKLYLRKATN